MHDALYTLTRDGRSVPAPEDEEEYYELMEWIDVVCLGSEKVFDEDTVGDPSRVSAAPTMLRALTFQGLISPEWLTQMLIEIM